MMDCNQPNKTTLQNFAACYFYLHGPVCLGLCIYGLITNIINISILTKKSMRNPINCLLTGIAVADMITMTSYVAFVIHFYLLNTSTPTPQRNTYGWMIFLRVHMNVTMTSYTASLWIGVIMSIMRYVIVSSPTAARMGGSRLNCRTSILLIFCAFCGAAFLIIPNSIITHLKPQYYNVSCLGNATIFDGHSSCYDGFSECTLGESTCSGTFLCSGNMTTSDNGDSLCVGNSTCSGGDSTCNMASYSTCSSNSTATHKDRRNPADVRCNGEKAEAEIEWWNLLMDLPIGKSKTTTAVVTFLVYPIFGKVIPIIFISVFGGLLLRTLWETDKRGRRLKGDNSSSHAQNRRTTVMLLSIIFMYIISEVPQSIVVIMCVALEGFFLKVYMPFTDFIDFLALINSAINFALYCTMSRQFRQCLTESVNECVKSLKVCKGKDDHRSSDDTTLTHV